MNTRDLNTPVSFNSHIDRLNSTATQSDYEENTAKPALANSSSVSCQLVLGADLSYQFTRITNQLNQQQLNSSVIEPVNVTNDVITPVDGLSIGSQDDASDLGSISKETFNMYKALNDNSDIIDSANSVVPIKFPSGTAGDNSESFSGVSLSSKAGFLKKSSSKIESAFGKASTTLAASANNLAKQSPMAKIFTGISFESFKFKELEDRVMNYNLVDVDLGDKGNSALSAEKSTVDKSFKTAPQSTLSNNKSSTQHNLWKMNEGQIYIESQSLAKLNPDLEIGLENLPKQRLSNVFKHSNKAVLCKKNIGSNNLVNLMVVGQQGMGKSTFVNTLFQSEILKTGSDFKNEYFDVGSKVAKKRIFTEYADPLNKDTPSTTTIQKTYVMLEENKVNLKLCIIDTPGFGDYSDNSFSWVPICEYIDSQYTNYMFNEEQPYRDLLLDSRVHCCLYFINPTNKGLTALDVIAMQEISKRVNLVPVIAKCDGLTETEFFHFKKDIKEIIKVQKIKICDLLCSENQVDYSEEVHENEKCLANMEEIYDYPFGVVGGTYFEDKQTFGRMYRHGFVDVMDENVSDFVKLRKFLVEDKTLDLIEKTNMYYEEWRDKLCMLRYKKVNEVIKMKELEAQNDKEEYEEGAVDNLLIPNIDDDKFNKMKGMVLEGDGINSNKLRVYEVYEVINKKYLDRHMIDWDPIFIHKQWELKKAFSSAVYEQDKKFKEWKRNLFNKQSKYNEEIDALVIKVKSYQRECSKIEETINKMRMGKQNNVKAT